jgi:hypothetical protein
MLKFFHSFYRPETETVMQEVIMSKAVASEIYATLKLLYVVC